MSVRNATVRDAKDPKANVSLNNRISRQLTHNLISLSCFAAILFAVHWINLWQQCTATLHLVGNHQHCHTPDRRTVLICRWRKGFLKCWRRWRRDRCAVDNENAAAIKDRFASTSKIVANHFLEIFNNLHR